ncbi:MAG: hypothetical protein IJR59_03780 [Firmicutes bacterium]|nr:hypothetical protein [Bacillota bacterium]
MCSADVLVLAIMAIFTLYGIYCGFITAVIRAASTFLSTVVSLVLYPSLCSAARQTGFFDMLKQAVIERLGIRMLFVENTRHAQNVLIEGLPLPEMFKEKLAVNNNSVVYDLLGVDNMVDYVGAFFANIILNIVVSVSVFLICLAVTRFILGAFNVLKKTPVIRTIGRVGGGLLGLVTSVVFIWALFAVMDAFVTRPFFSAMYEDIMQSQIAIVLYNTDLIRAFMLKRMF